MMAAPYPPSQSFVSSPLTGAFGLQQPQTISTASGSGSSRRRSGMPVLDGLEAVSQDGRYPTITPGARGSSERQRPHTEPKPALDQSSSSAVDRAMLKNTSLPLPSGWQLDAISPMLTPTFGTGPVREVENDNGENDSSPWAANANDPVGIPSPDANANAFADRYGLDASLQARTPSLSDRKRISSLPAAKHLNLLSTSSTTDATLTSPNNTANIIPTTLQPAPPDTGIDASLSRASSTGRAGIGAGMRASLSPTSPIVPLSASPSYSPPVSAQPRAYAQQPTLSYVSPTVAAAQAQMSPVNGNNGSYPGPGIPPASPQMLQQQQQQQQGRQLPPRPPQEEVCIECAMRDADMADVDVTSPGIWERESDVHYQDLVEREEADRRAGKAPGHNGRPPSRGTPLTEPYLKIWLTMNPKEPQARQQTLDLYVKTQTALLEAEAIARERAMRESRQLETKMRDQYALLRRSAYDLASPPQNANELGPNAGASGSGSSRKKNPRSVSTSAAAVFPTAAYVTVSPPHNAPNARDIVVQENGLIVEHVDVRREEREERERRKKEERRERSRASGTRRASGSHAAQDLTTSSGFSAGGATSPIPGQNYPDSGFFTHEHQRSTSQYSQQGSNIGRPSSLAGMSTAPSKLSVAGRDGNIYMHPSVSSAQSVGSSQLTPNRRSRFMDFKSWGAPWMSRDSLAPSGFSGSMHVALDHEKSRSPLATEFNLPSTAQGAIDLNSAAPTLREAWPTNPSSPTPDEASQTTVVNGNPIPGKQPKKVKKGLKKMWKIVTGSASKSDTNLLRGSPAPNGAQKFTSDGSSVDDLPLAPPPPMSYLANRTSGGGTGAAPVVAERAVTASPVGSRNNVSMTSSANRPLSSSTGTGFSPQTAPSSSLPSPTSSRILWPQHERDCLDTRKSGGVADLELDGHPPTIDEEGMMYVTSSDVINTPKAALHPTASEPDLRRQSFLGPKQTLPPSSLSTESRPKSIFMVDKELPPIPPPSAVSASLSATATNSETPVAAVPGVASTYNLPEPHPTFRATEGRRSSFDVAPRPRIAAQTMPINGDGRGAKGGILRPMTIVGGSEYDDFALTRHHSNLDAYGRPMSPLTNSATVTATGQRSESRLSKRRSKFSLGALIGKKSSNNNNINHVAVDRHQKSPSHSSTLNTLNNQQYDFPGVHVQNSPMAMAMTPRGKPLDELVNQEREFVAYRYPSRDDRLDLLQT